MVALLARLFCIGNINTLLYIRIKLTIHGSLTTHTVENSSQIWSVSETLPASCRQVTI